MDIAINIILLLAGFVGAIVAIGGDTWHKGEESLLKRITNRGWLSIFILSLTLSLGVVKELRSLESQKELVASRELAEKKLDEATTSLLTSQQGLAEANQKLEKAQQSLASIEPDILEGMFQLTERIPREQDFAFADVNGQSRIIPRSSETRGPLKLFGGDVFEWHHFCRYPENASFRNRELDQLLNNRRPFRPFVLDTGFRKYELPGKEGELRISGPIGQELNAVIENPTEFRNCGFKIVVRSTDRTRTQSQFEPLLRKIRDAKEALSENG